MNMRHRKYVIFHVALLEFESVPLASINGSQLAKIKESSFLACPCHRIHMIEAVGQKSSNYTLKITIFVTK